MRCRPSSGSATRTAEPCRQVRAASASSASRCAAASNVTEISWSRTESPSSTASPASVVPFGLATRRATSSIVSPRRRRHPRGAEHRFERDDRGDLGAEAPLLAGLAQRVDEPGDIGGAGAGERADRGELDLVGHPRREAERREQLGDLRRAAHRPRPRCTSATTPRRIATGRLGMARTIAAALGKRCARRGDLDAGQDRHDDRLRRQPAVSCGATSSSFCGLKPRMTSFGGGPASAERLHGAHAVDLFAARADDDERCDRSSPAERQPSTIAPAMLPQPTNQVGSGNCGMRHASPCVSISAAEIASPGDLPPHSTNWNTG